MPSVSVYNCEGKKVEDLKLPEVIFGGRIKKDILYQAVNKYRASQRQGTASTKERGSVRGGGKKPYRQKGTGMARAGSNRSPLWRGGGVVFGPSPRDFHYTLPRKIRTAALRESLNDKFLNKDFYVINAYPSGLVKTKDFAKTLAKLKIDSKVLIVTDKEDPDIRRVARNIPFVEILRANDANAFDILRFKKVLMTKRAYQTLISRIHQS